MPRIALIHRCSSSIYENLRSSIFSYVVKSVASVNPENSLIASSSIFLLCMPNFFKLSEVSRDFEPDGSYF